MGTKDSHGASGIAAEARGLPVIVLGAGRGTRFGGPKLFAEHKGRGFLERILTRCHEAGARVTLVTDPRDKAPLETLLASLPPALTAPFPRIVTADGEQDMMTSARAALAQGPYEPGFWLWPVDAPFISAGGWRLAVETAARDANVVWKLRVRGRTGHPIWFPFHTAQAILTGSWPDGLRGFLNTQATQATVRIQVLALEDEYLDDVNTTGQLAALGWVE